MLDNKQMSPMMTSGEVARFLNVHINTVRQWGKQGVIQSYRIGPRGDRRFARDGITNLLHRLHKNFGDVKKAKEDLGSATLH